VAYIRILVVTVEEHLLFEKYVVVCVLCLVYSVCDIQYVWIELGSTQVLKTVWIKLQVY